MADEQSAAAWNAAAEDFECADLAVTQLFTQKSPAPRRRPMVMRTAVAAVLVIVLSIWLGHPSGASRG